MQPMTSFKIYIYLNQFEIVQTVFILFLWPFNILFLMHFCYPYSKKPTILQGLGIAEIR